MASSVKDMPVAEGSPLRRKVNDETEYEMGAVLTARIRKGYTTTGGPWRLSVYVYGFESGSDAEDFLLHVAEGADLVVPDKEWFDRAWFFICTAGVALGGLLGWALGAMS